MYFTAYLGWKTVKLEGIGTIQVPNNWVYTKVNDIIYFTSKPLSDNECIVYLVQPKGYINKNTAVINIYNINTEYLTNILDDRLLSNDINFGQKEFQSKDVIKREYFIGFFDLEKYTELITWGNHVEYSTLEKIARSYESE
jgi:hypothetical protein